MPFPITNQNPVNSSNTITSYQPTEEEQTVSAPHSRKRKERDEEVSIAFRTNVLRSSSPSSNPLPSTILPHSSSAFTVTPQFNTGVDLNLRPEDRPSNTPPMLAGHVSAISPILYFIYGTPLPGGNFMFTNHPDPLTLVPTLLNPESPELSPGAPITVFPQLMVFAQPGFSFPPSMISAISGMFEAPNFQGQIAQPVAISTNSEHPELPVSTRYVSDSHYIPSFLDAFTNSGISEAPGFEWQVPQPVAIPTNSEKSEQLATFADRITGKDIKRFFQKKGITYSADVFVNPAYQDEIRKIWSACPRLLSSKRTQEGKACWNYLKKIKELGDDPSLQALEIRKISIKLQNGETKEDYGVFATKTIEKNTIIGIYAAKLKPLDKIKDEDYTFNLPNEGFGDWGIDGTKMGNITRFINHSTRENENICTVVFYDKITPRIMFIVGKKAINEGDQLLYDYGDDYWKRKNITQAILRPS